jgi:lysosomal-associated membrane protein 1/2
MKKITALVLCSALILVSGGDPVDKKNDKQPSHVEPPSNNGPIIPTVIPAPTSTTAKPTTSSTTPSTTTTSTTPSTTTTTTSTTTTEPTTTSTSTTPTPPTTNAPITTTTPVPEPSTKKWSINNTDGTLIIAKMAVQIEVMYNNTKQQQISKKLDIPTDNSTKVSAEFTPFNETMKLSWKSAGSSENSVELRFTQSRDNKTYALNGLKVTIAPEELPDFTSNSSLILVHTAEHFNTSTGNSYRCVKLQRFNLTAENSSAIVGQLKVTDLQFQAFKTDKKTSFGFAEDCAFDTPDVVPIAVGCVLAGLVVIVLGAYLINRRRSQARGYLSM